MQLVKHCILVRSSWFTWLIFFPFVPSVLLPVLCWASHSSRVPQARLWGLIYFGASHFLASKDLSVSVLVQFCFWGSVCGRHFILEQLLCPFQMSLCLSGYIALCEYGWVFQMTEYILMRFTDGFHYPSKALLSWLLPFPYFFFVRLIQIFALQYACVPSELS